MQMNLLGAHQEIIFPYFIPCKNFFGLQKILKSVEEILKDQI